MPLTWATGPDADTCTLELGGGAGEATIRLYVRVADRQWFVGTPGRWCLLVSGVCFSRHDGRRAALDAIEATLQTALAQVRDWRASL